MHRTSPLAWLGRSLAAILVITVAGACSSDPKPPAPETVQTTVAQPDPAADMAAAEKANLVATDLPSGWNSRPHEKLPGEDELGPGIATCLGITPPSTRATAEARSFDFTQSLASVSSVVIFVKSPSDAAADAVAFSSDKFGECIKPGYEKQAHEVAPEGNTVSEVTTTRLDIPALGDRSTAHRFSAKIVPGPGITIPVTVDVVHVFKGRAEVELIVTAPISPFPTDFTFGLAAAVAGRL